MNLFVQTQEAESVCPKVAVGKHLGFIATFVACKYLVSYLFLYLP